MSLPALILSATLQTITLTSPPTITQGEVNEFSLSEVAKPENPYDPKVASLDAVITDPSGKSISVPGYWDVVMTRKLEGGKEVVSPTPKEGWKLRWAPRVPGKHTIVATLMQPGIKVKMTTLAEVVKNDSSGFIGIHPKNPRFFADAKGKTFYPLGPDVCWGNEKGTYSYDEWLAEYAKVGINYGRLWLSPQWTTFGLESRETGWGKINPGSAWRLDYVMKLAQEKGIHLMLCFESFNVLQAGQQYSGWVDSVYNKANGGPLANPAEFWDSPEANRVFVNKMRYLVARYGAYRSVFSWEFWNEVDLVNSFDPQKTARWHDRMSTTLAALDPYDHLITTSAASTPGVQAIDKVPGIQYVQSHHYSSPDIAVTVAETEMTKRIQFPNKPHYFGEIGADWAGPRIEDDPEGYQIHDTMWASVAAGSSGVASTWWWDNLIAPKKLYPLYLPVAKFLKGVDPAAEGFKPAGAVFKSVGKVSGTRDLVLENGPSTWENNSFNKPKTISINQQGASGPLPLAGIQHGARNHPDKVNPVTFLVTAPKPIKLTVDVLEVSGYGGAGLQVLVNGKAVLDKEFTDPDDNAVTTPLTQFAGGYTVEIPAGKSTVVVRNSGNDWFRVAYRFQGLISSSAPPVIGWNSAGRTTHIAWIRRQEASWFNLFQRKQKFPAAPDVKLVLPLAEGAWRVERWDTWKGTVLGSVHVKSVGKPVEVMVPSFRHDVAIKAVKVG